MDPSATPPGGNLLNREVDYLWTETALGSWRRYMYSDGSMFAEYVSHAKIGNIPFIHITWGKSPEIGRRLPAVGIVAIGRRATGAIAIGQLAVGLVAIGQLALGVLAGFGQASTGAVAIGQVALAAAVGVGQAVYSGFIAVGQVGRGNYVLAQIGFGEHVIDTRQVDPAAQEFFLKLVGQ